MELTGLLDTQLLNDWDLHDEADFLTWGADWANPEVLQHVRDLIEQAHLYIEQGPPPTPETDPEVVPETSPEAEDRSEQHIDIPPKPIFQHTGIDNYHVHLESGYIPISSDMQHAINILESGHSLAPSEMPAASHIKVI